jgi:hypothetical protein
MHDLVVGLQVNGERRLRGFTQPAGKKSGALMSDRNAKRHVR